MIPAAAASCPATWITSFHGIRNATETFDSLHLDELAAAQLGALARRVDEARAGQVAALEPDGAERGAEEVGLLEPAVAKDDPLETCEAERGEIEPSVGDVDILEHGLGEVGSRGAERPQLDASELPVGRA